MSIRRAEAQRVAKGSRGLSEALLVLPAVIPIGEPLAETALRGRVMRLQFHRAAVQLCNLIRCTALLGWQAFGHKHQLAR